MNTAELGTEFPFAVRSGSVLHLPSGLLGFEGIKKFVFNSNPGEEPFHWLIAEEDPALAFLVVSPADVTASYEPDLPTEDVGFLGLEAPEDACLLNIVTLRPKGCSTVNLKGPIVINRHTHIGKQVIPSNAAEYSVQHPLPTE